MEFQMFVLIVHIIAGSIALITAAGSFVTKKGREWHARVGKVYSFAMIVVALSAFILVILGSPMYLMMVGIFAGYIVAVGWRRAMNRGGEVNRIDRILIAIGIVGMLGLFVTSIAILSGSELITTNGKGAIFGIVPLIFAGICGGLVWVQVRVDKKGLAPRGKLRIIQHVVFMGSGTIATVTAFLVTAVSNSVFVWVIPTVVGTAGIIFWTRKVNDGKITPP
tara:strand:+ start:8735 stop:9400 length:666 start_codon:yes stop_codon:yes gene_type:complete